MKLYYSPGACSQAPHIALHELGLAFEAVRVDLATHTLPDGGDYYAINPKGYVPALELDDGSLLTENNVILQYLADRRPGSLAPAYGGAERWRLMEWLAFISTELHAGFGPLWWPSLTAATRAGVVEKLGRRFTLLEATLDNHPYLGGERFTIADAYLFVVLNWSRLHKVDLAPWPALGAFQARVAARPAVIATLRAEGLAPEARRAVSQVA